MYIYNRMYVYNIYKEYHSTINQSGILPFAATWTELEGVMLSEISQTETDKYCMI